jgi:hypothetical protein
MKPLWKESLTSILFVVPKVFAAKASLEVKPGKTVAPPVVTPDTLEYGIFGDARYGRWCSFCWPGEYEDCDVEPPRDCELMVAGLG